MAMALRMKKAVRQPNLIGRAASRAEIDTQMQVLFIKRSSPSFRREVHELHHASESGAL
jgi:hypothetical protein